MSSTEKNLPNHYLSKVKWEPNFSNFITALFVGLLDLSSNLRGSKYFENTKLQNNRRKALQYSNTMNGYRRNWKTAVNMEHESAPKFPAFNWTCLTIINLVIIIKCPFLKCAVHKIIVTSMERKYTLDDSFFDPRVSKQILQWIVDWFLIESKREGN